MHVRRATQVVSNTLGDSHVITVVAVGLLFAFGNGPNFLLALLACVVLAIGGYLFWRPIEKGVLFAFFAYQWAEVFTTIADSNLRGLALTEYLYQYPRIEDAAFLALIGLVFQAIGMRVGAGRSRVTDYADLCRHVYNVPPKTWLYLHLIVSGVSIAALEIAKLIPGFSQPLLALAYLRWCTFVILTIVTFMRAANLRPIWLLIFIVEFFAALGGYFSSFKLVFVYTLIALVIINVRVTIRHALGSLAAVMMMLAVGIYWTAIKPQYRAFVSGGQSAQTVEVGKFEAINKAYDLALLVKIDQLPAAAESLTRRFSDIGPFAATLDYVPRIVPHEGGAIWEDAIARPFMPRVLFPNKAGIDESAITTRYTGRQVAGLDEGTQIGLGYFPESYVDFGEAGMMAALLGFGVFLGAVYRVCVRHPRARGLIGVGLAAAILLQQNSIVVSSAKIVGGLVVSTLVALLLLNFIVPRYRRFFRI